MKNTKYKVLALLTFLAVNTACIDDLNTEPKVEQTLENLLAADPNAVEGLLSRLYASFALSSVEDRISLIFPELTLESHRL